MRQYGNLTQEGLAKGKPFLCHRTLKQLLGLSVLRNCESINCDKRTAEPFDGQGAVPQAGWRLSRKPGAVWQTRIRHLIGNQMISFAPISRGNGSPFCPGVHN